MSKRANLENRKKILVAEAALLRAETTVEVCQAKEGWMVASRMASRAYTAIFGALRFLR